MGFTTTASVASSTSGESVQVPNCCRRVWQKKQAWCIVAAICIMVVVTYLALGHSATPHTPQPTLPPRQVCADGQRHCSYDGVDHCCNKSPFSGLVCGLKPADWRKADCSPSAPLESEDATHPTSHPTPQPMLQPTQASVLSMASMEAP